MKDCTTCAHFVPIDDKYGHCECPHAGGGHSMVVEIITGCTFHSENVNIPESDKQCELTDKPE